MEYGELKDFINADLKRLTNAKWGGGKIPVV